MAGLTFAVLESLGCCLLIIPGAIVALFCGFYVWIIVDKDMGSFASLKSSFHVVRPAFLEVLLLVVLLGLIYLGVNFLTIIPFLGELAGLAILLVVWPVMGLVMTHAYLALIGESTDSDRADQPSDDSLYTESPA